MYYGILCKAVEYNMNKTYRFLKLMLLKTGGCYLVRQTVPDHFFLDLKEIDLFGVKLKVPLETERYFEYTFGDDWRIPKQNHQYTKKFIRVIQGSKPKSLKYHSNSIQS